MLCVLSLKDWNVGETPQLLDSTTQLRFSVLTLTRALQDGFILNSRLDTDSPFLLDLLKTLTRKMCMCVRVCDSRSVMCFKSDEMDYRIVWYSYVVAASCEREEEGGESENRKCIPQRVVSEVVSIKRKTKKRVEESEVITSFLFLISCKSLCIYLQ